MKETSPILRGADPDPARCEEPDWGVMCEADRRESDALEAPALARYIAAGHAYQMALRSPNAVRWLERGQFVFFARLDASDEFWRIVQELKGNT